MPRDLIADPPKRQPRDLLSEQKSGSVLPVSTTPEGGWKFDSDAGVVGAAKRGATLPGDVASGEVPRLVPLYPDEVGKSELGAIMVDNPDYYDRAAETAGLATPLSAASRGAPARNLMGRKVRDKPEPPSREQLLKTGSEQFDQGRKLDVRFEPRYVNQLGREAETRLTQEGFDPTNAPKTFKLLQDIQQVVDDPEAFASYDDILKIRNRLKKARMDFNNPADKAAAERVIGLVEGFVEKAAGGPGVRSGPAGELAATHRSGLGNYAAGKRSLDIGNIGKSALRRSAAANSGKNIGNTLRQRAASLLDSPKKLKGFSKEEIAALEKVAQGTVTQNVLRDVAHILGGGGGFGNMFSGATVGGGAAYLAGGDPVIGTAAGLGAMAAGRAAKSGTNLLTRRAMQNIDRMTRERSPLYRQMVESAPWKEANPMRREAMLKSLIAYLEEGRAGQQPGADAPNPAPTAGPSPVSADAPLSGTTQAGINWSVEP